MSDLVYAAVFSIYWLAGKLLNVLLYPFAELAGWLVMRGLRRWAKSPRPFGV